jgi:hypothetical protein
METYIVSIDDEQAGEIVVQSLTSYYEILKEDFGNDPDSKIMDAISTVLSHYLTREKYLDWLKNDA